MKLFFRKNTKEVHLPVAAHHVDVDVLGLPLLEVGVDGRVVGVGVAAARRSLQGLQADLLLQGLQAFPVAKNRKRGYFYYSQNLCLNLPLAVTKPTREGPSAILVSSCRLIVWRKLNLVFL